MDDNYQQSKWCFALFMLSGNHSRKISGQDYPKIVMRYYSLQSGENMVSVCTSLQIGLMFMSLNILICTVFSFCNAPLSQVQQLFNGSCKYALNMKPNMNMNNHILCWKVHNTKEYKEEAIYWLHFISCQICWCRHLQYPIITKKTLPTASIQQQLLQ